MKAKFDRYRGKMECFFGLIGVSFSGAVIIISALVTPNYSMIIDTVSSLGLKDAKTMFSISFVTAGALGIPFYIFLESTLKDQNRILRKWATGIAITTCLFIAFVGILPNPDFPVIFTIFHGIAALIAFIGSSFYIVLYSYLMKEEKLYSQWLTYLGYIVGGLFIVFILFFILSIFLSIIFFAPLFEWILTIFILIWILSVAVFMIFTRDEKLSYMKEFRLS